MNTPTTSQRDPETDPMQTESTLRGDEENEESQNGRLGIAIYDSQTAELCVTETWEDNDFENLQLIKFQTNPTTIITHSFYNCEKFGQAIKYKPEESNHSFEVKILKSSDFNYESAKNKLLTLNVLSTPSDLTTADKIFYMSSRVEFDNIQMIRAAGGLISYLLSSGIVNQLEDNSVPFTVSSITSFSLPGCLRVDANTLQSLQIFVSEDHPSVLGKGRAKEGLSLFGIMNHCKSPAGKRLLRSWFLRPALDSQIIQNRLDTVSFLLEPVNTEFLKQLGPCLGHIKDIPRIMGRIQSAKASITDWRNLFQTALYGIKIKELCAYYASKSKLPIFVKVEEILGGDLVSLVSLISSIIDFDESKEAMRLVIKPGVSEELDELKRNYAGLDDFLTRVAKEEMDSLPPSLASEMHIVYYPQIGFQICLPFDNQAPLEKQTDIPGLTYQFHTGNKIYFKNQRTIDLDEFVGDIHNNIVDAETYITHQLEIKVMQYSHVLFEMINIIAELDCLISLAITAQDMNYQRPNLTHENVIYIEGGRHPLQELCVHTFIPNNTSLCSGREGGLQLITGPNFSGKSVYLKQVALIVYMAHLGSFVPADSALIGFTDRIFCRVHSRETVSLTQSTFLIDCSQVAVMLRHASERSVLIIDEFGKGTNPVDGVSLLGATINYLLHGGNNCPKTLICNATHFSELLEYDLLQKHDNLQLLTMDFMVSTQENGELIFLYKLIRGTTNRSYGNFCAKLSGVPEVIVKRAEELLDRFSKGEGVTTTNSSDNDKKEKRYKSIVEKFLQFNCDNGTIDDFLVDILREE